MKVMLKSYNLSPIMAAAISYQQFHLCRGTSEKGQ